MGERKYKITLKSIKNYTCVDLYLVPGRKLYDDAWILWINLELIFLWKKEKEKEKEKEKRKRVEASIWLNLKQEERKKKQ